MNTYKSMNHEPLFASHSTRAIEIMMMTIVSVPKNVAIVTILCKTKYIHFYSKISHPKKTRLLQSRLCRLHRIHLRLLLFLPQKHVRAVRTEIYAVHPRCSPSTYNSGWHKVGFQSIYIFKDFIYLFLEREEGKKKKRERNISVWLPLALLMLGTWPATQPATLWFTVQRSIY